MRHQLLNTCWCGSYGETRSTLSAWVDCRLWPVLITFLSIRMKRSASPLASGHSGVTFRFFLVSLTNVVKSVVTANHPWVTESWEDSVEYWKHILKRCALHLLHNRKMGVVVDDHDQFSTLRGNHERIKIGAELQLWLPGMLTCWVDSIRLRHDELTGCASFHELFCHPVDTREPPFWCGGAVSHYSLMLEGLDDPVST